jgi:hypothetical protein
MFTRFAFTGQRDCLTNNSKSFLTHEKIIALPVPGLGPAAILTDKRVEILNINL